MHLIKNLFVGYCDLSMSTSTCGENGIKVYDCIKLGCCWGEEKCFKNIGFTFNHLIGFTFYIIKIIPGGFFCPLVKNYLIALKLYMR